MLPLLPVDPVGCTVVRPGEPGLDGITKGSLAPEPGGEGKVGQLQSETMTELPQRPELGELTEVVKPVAGGRSLGNHESGTLEVSQHSRRPPGRLCRRADSQTVHATTLP